MNRLSALFSKQQYNRCHSALQQISADKQLLEKQPGFLLLYNANVFYLFFPSLQLPSFYSPTHNYNLLFLFVDY